MLIFWVFSKILLSRKKWNGRWMLQQGLWLQHSEKMEHTIWKSITCWTEKQCQIVCGILYDLFYCMTSSATNVLSNDGSWHVLKCPKMNKVYFLYEIIIFGKIWQVDDSVSLKHSTEMTNILRRIHSVLLKKG